MVQAMAIRTGGDPALARPLANALLEQENERLRAENERLAAELGVLKAARENENRREIARINAYCRRRRTLGKRIVDVCAMTIYGGTLMLKAVWQTLRGRY